MHETLCTLLPHVAMWRCRDDEYGISLRLLNSRHCLPQKNFCEARAPRYFIQCRYNCAGLGCIHPKFVVDYSRPSRLILSTTVDQVD
eukprot:3209864-Prymnesium_polylepis.1